MANLKANSNDPKRRTIAQIDAIITLACCGGAYQSEASPTTEIAAATGGAQLAKVVCDVCGTEYLFGIIAQTVEQSRASDVFEEVPADILAEAGVDTGDYDPAPDTEIRMCARCDKSLEGSRDLCRGCGEYVCATCRERVIPPHRAGRHQAHEHWEEPKFREVSSEQPDDGSHFDFDDDADTFKPTR